MDRVMEGWGDYIDFVERPHEKFGGLPVCVLLPSRAG
jgi:hypothetical protein